MKNLTKRFTLSAAKGFTLIELLIVIAVLGVLAVAVLSAINPIEQINRGRDTGSRSDAEQLLGAMDRFYTSSGYYPWQTGATDTTHLAQAWHKVDDTWTDSGAAVKVLTGKLADTAGSGTGEVKSAFITRLSSTTYNTLYVYNGGEAGNSTYVCFKALSGSFALEGRTRCGTPAGANLPPDLVAVAASICVNKAEYVCLP